MMVVLLAKDPLGRKEWTSVIPWLAVLTTASLRVSGSCLPHRYTVPPDQMDPRRAL
jgi:hypothetical protein